MDKETKNVKHNDLGYLGLESQYAIVKNLMTNREFFYEIEGYIDEKSFTDVYLGMVVKMILSKFKETGQVPTMKELEVIARDTVYEKTDRKYISDMLGKISSVDAEIMGETLNDAAIKFFKGQRLEKIIKNGTQSLNKYGFTDELQARLIEQIQSIGILDTVGRPVAVTEDVIWESLGMKSDDMVPTGIPELDEKMAGGLAKGNTGILIAGTGVGKTTFGSVICCNAILRNYKVLHIFFEDLKEEIMHKYYARLTGVDTRSFKNLTDEEKREFTKLIFDSHPNAKTALKDNLRLFRMEGGITQVEDIIRVVNQMIKIDGWKPDMIYIDYLGCIQPSSDRRNKYDNEGVAMEVAMKRIDAFAKNNDIAIWVSQQTNRTAGQDDNLDTPSKRMATIQGAFRAIQPCTRVLYLIRVPGEFDRVNLYLDKARNAETSSWENAFFDNATCQINLSDSESGDVFDYRREEYEEPDTPEALGLR